VLPDPSLRPGATMPASQEVEEIRAGTDALEEASAVPKPTFRRFVVWVLASLVLAATLLAVWIEQDRRRTLADWRSRLESIADDRQLTVELWLSERLADARSWSAYPTLIAQASRNEGAIESPSGRGADDDRDHLEAILSSSAEAYGYTGVWLLDGGGRPLAASSEVEPLLDAARDMAREVVGDGRARFEFHRRGDRIRLTLATPLVAPTSRAGAVILSESDPAKVLYPRLLSEQVPTSTGETLLIRRSGETFSYLSPGRHHDVGKLLEPRPLLPGLAASPAVAEPGSFGEAVDFRGERLLSASRAIQGTDWILLANVDQAEALSLHRWIVKATSIGLAAILASLFGAGFALRRAEAASTRAQVQVAEARHRTLQDSVQEELQRSLAELRAIFEGSTVGLALLDPAGHPIKINPALERFLGYPGPELSRMALSELTHPEDRDVDAALHRELTGGERDSYQVEKRYIRKDGRVVWGRLTVSRVQGPGGGPRFAIGMIEDFTERRQLQLEIQQLNKMEAIGRLAGGIAHDFNNILSVILGYGELMLAELGSDQPLRPLLEEVLTAADRAALLTKQLLAFSRKQTLEPKVLDLGTVVNDLAQLFRRVLGEDLQIVLQAAPGVGRVRADRAQMEQILMNLVVNARDAMRDGGRLTIATDSVELDADFAARHPGSTPGPHVRLSIQDTGTGMSREVLTRIFEPFFTTKDPGKGTGLGLSTVYGIVKQSGGYIGVESTPGEGTRFDIYLPRVEDPASESPAASPAPPRGTETVLVVEDETSLRLLLRAMLPAYGYEVRVAPTALAAIDICSQSPGDASIDLLLTDIVMPDMNGLELARRIRHLRPAVRVLYMSGYTEDVLLQRGELESGSFMIAKPFSGAALARKVREALDSRA
jgi:PAS domain S-box-containing protein